MFRIDGAVGVELQRPIGQDGHGGGLRPVVVDHAVADHHGFSVGGPSDIVAGECQHRVILQSLLFGQDRRHGDIVAGGLRLGDPARKEVALGSQHIRPEQLPIPGIVDANEGDALLVHVQPGPVVLAFALDIDGGDGFRLLLDRHLRGRPNIFEHGRLRRFSRSEANRQHRAIQPKGRGVIAARGYGGHFCPVAYITLARAVVARGHHGAVRLQANGGAGAAGNGHDVRPAAHVTLSISIVARSRHSAIRLQTYRVIEPGGDGDHVGPVLHIALAVVVGAAGHHGPFAGKGHGVPGAGSYVRHAVPILRREPVQGLAAHQGHMAVLLKDQGMDQAGGHLLHVRQGRKELLCAEGFPAGHDTTLGNIEHAGEAGEHLVRLLRRGGVSLIPGDPGGHARHSGVPCAC